MIQDRPSAHKLFSTGMRGSVPLHRFNNRARPLRLPALDLRLVDIVGRPDDVQARIKAEFDHDFGRFLNRRFPDEELCRSMDHLNPLLNAYVDDRAVRIAEGDPVLSVEDWSRENGAPHVRDDVSLPHQGVRWFELRSISTGERVGAIQISRIELIRVEAQRAYLSGFAIMTLPRHETLTFPEFWGDVLRAILDREFVEAEDPSFSFTFEEWVFPVNDKARYVQRGEDTFGADIIRRASAGLRMEIGDDTIERAPRNLRRTLRRAALPEGDLRILRDAVVRRRQS